MKEVKKTNDTANRRSSSLKNVNFCCFFTGYGYIDVEDSTKVMGILSGKGMRFNQRRLKFAFKGLESGMEYKVRCLAYYEDTPDEIGESTTLFKIETPPEGGEIVMLL